MLHKCHKGTVGILCSTPTPECYYCLEAFWEKRNIKIISHLEKSRIIVSALKDIGGDQVSVVGLYVSITYI